MKSRLYPLPRWLLLSLVFYIVAFGWLVVARLVPKPPLVLPENLELSNRPTLGRTDAPISIVVFFDFQCPHCKDFDREVLPRLEREFVNSGRVKITYLHNPFMSEDSFTAAVATECVYQQNPQAYWLYSHAVFELQRPLHGWATLEKLMKAAEGTALTDIDLTDLAVCIRTRKGESAVEADKVLADQFGVDHVPTVFLNGQKEGGSYLELQKAVSREGYAIEGKVRGR